MRLEYVRVSKADSGQALNLQIDALLTAASKRQMFIRIKHQYKTKARPGLWALRKDDTFYCMET